MKAGGTCWALYIKNTHSWSDYNEAKIMEVSIDFLSSFLALCKLVIQELFVN